MASVEIHPDFEHAFSAISDQHPDFQNQLIADFIRFIETDRMEYPAYFGRDSIYNWPHKAQIEGVSHMHIALPPRTFSGRRTLIDRTNPKDPDLDACLIYCEHAIDRGRIMFLDFFYPNAHQIARNERRMNYLARQAEKFHDDW
ncbi:type II toxin-antitoxin system YafO family toxin [Vreelandella boliviensis]|uniref:type II toxin-antitoxin system YafO family toxin n=1 Tax=Vreelandella boliviensis TaxID=223527 RepID=UPI001B8D8B4D|nr:type II toxin-antitoxin system YafO family toxin [Halomonas boliviensis]MBS3668011.1 type II toxin-antitoxin system YafO family toxin [Halomonas boliviensis]